MNWYILEQNKRLQLVKVLPADDANFLEDYGNDVKASGNDIAAMLHSYLVLRAESLDLTATLQPGLRKLKAIYPNHQLSGIDSYYLPNIGWIKSSAIHPQNGHLLTWLGQLTVPFQAGATKLHVRLAPRIVGRLKIIHADFTLQEIMQ